MWRQKLSFHDLFNDTLSSSDYIVSNVTMISEEWIRNDVEEAEVA
jgi:hypothetical protein